MNNQFQNFLNKPLTIALTNGGTINGKLIEVTEYGLIIDGSQNSAGGVGHLDQFNTRFIAWTGFLYVDLAVGAGASENVRRSA